MIYAVWYARMAQGIIAQDSSIDYTILYIYMHHTRDHASLYVYIIVAGIGDTGTSQYANAINIHMQQPKSQHQHFQQAPTYPNVHTHNANTHTHTHRPPYGNGPQTFYPQQQPPQPPGQGNYYPYQHQNQHKHPERMYHSSAGSNCLQQGFHDGSEGSRLPSRYPGPGGASTANTFYNLNTSADLRSSISSIGSDGTAVSVESGSYPLGSGSSNSNTNNSHSPPSHLAMSMSGSLHSQHRPNTLWQQNTHTQMNLRNTYPPPSHASMRGHTHTHTQAAPALDANVKVNTNAAFLDVSMNTYLPKINMSYTGNNNSNGSSNININSSGSHSHIPIRKSGSKEDPTKATKPEPQESPNSKASYKAFYKAFCQIEAQSSDDAIMFAKEEMEKISPKVKWRLYLDVGDINKRINRVDEV